MLKQGIKLVWVKMGLMGWMAMLLLAVVGTSAVGKERVERLSVEVNRSGLEVAPQLVAQRERRMALVIGNGSYTEGGKLRNPPNDAADMASALQQLGFEVMLLRDVDKRRIEEAIDQFNYRLRQGGVGLFYYAGHGVQVNGENYLIPIRAKISREQDVQYEAVALGRLLGAMEDAKNPINLVLIDACRNNPYSRGWRSSSRGLAFVQSAEGTFISFATAPAKEAADGEGRNSPYTASLLQHIQTPGIPVPLLFQRVRQSVRERTNQQQTPWESSSLIGDFFFKAAASVATSPLPIPSPQPSPSPFVAIRPSPSPSPQPTVPLPVPLPAAPTLISKATGVNYTTLQNLLMAGKWEVANLNTRRMMLQAAGIDEGLRDSDFDNFSCEDLRIIDQLWVNASDGKFGFSIQSQIYRDLGGTREYDADIWSRFLNKVGWIRVEGGRGIPIRWNQRTFNLTAVNGHLPLPPVRDGMYMRDGEKLLFRIANCNL